ncbi:MAG: excinuclease ABC subunit UvrC [Prevotellaceae bacterium]|nr:excinuclease ABC subunit UvrC [Prevotellaceae bacterium]
MAENVAEHLKNIVDNLPDCPGCYQFLDETGRIIYVGKAKKLKRRVASYFQKEHENRKTRHLVQSIRDIKYVVVNTEEDALLLENNLIKQWNPKYNILLKDGKTYPSILVTNEYFPRIFQTRKINKRSGTYFGPYSHVPTMHTLLELIANLYPIRTCKGAITAEGIESGKYRECLDYYIHKCGGACIGKTSREEYLRWIGEAKEILKGNTRAIEGEMVSSMKRLAEELRFEEAEAVKRRYLMLENYRSKSEVVSYQISNVDVFNIVSDEKIGYVNYLHVTNGCITQAFTFELKKRLEETDEELLTLGIGEMRKRYGSKSKEIILPFHVELQLEGVVYSVPQRGEKRKLLELSKLNVLQYRKDRISQSDKLNPEQKGVRLMKELQKALGMGEIPAQIECFDNSNMQGTDAVAACVVFLMGKPSKKDYRKYTIKTVEGADDYASMREVVRRRYSRMKAEGTRLPDLIIADGGRGQMESIREIVEDELGLSIPIAGLAKNDKHRTNELLYGFPPKVIGMKTDSPLFFFLTRVQDEVHRFAITFHRAKRSRHQLASELDEIKGIGKKSKAALLKRFGSVKRIRSANEEALAAVIGKKKAKIIRESLGNEVENA